LARDRFGLISPYKKLARRFVIWRGLLGDISGFVFGLFSGYVQVIFWLFSGYFPGYSRVIFWLCSGYFRVIFKLFPARDASEPFRAARHIFARRKTRAPKHQKYAPDAAKPS